MGNFGSGHQTSHRTTDAQSLSASSGTSGRNSEQRGQDDMEVGEDEPAQPIVRLVRARRDTSYQPGEDEEEGSSG